MPQKRKTRVNCGKIWKSLLILVLLPSPVLLICFSLYWNLFPSSQSPKDLLFDDLIQGHQTHLGHEASLRAGLGPQTSPVYWSQHVGLVLCPEPFLCAVCSVCTGSMQGTRLVWDIQAAPWARWLGYSDWIWPVDWMPQYNGGVRLQ